MALDGTYDCTIKTPMGEQRVKLTVDVDGDTFTGSATDGGDVIPCENGKVDGDTLTWTMKVTKPMALSLDCEATVSGDTLDGSVSPGIFGTFPITGTRIA